MAPLRDEVVLVQPLSRELVGKAEARKAFAKILKRFPGVCGTVHSHVISDDLYLYIDWTLKAPIGDRMIAVPIIDKFWFLDGLVSKLTAYFDPAPIIKATSSGCVCCPHCESNRFLKALGYICPP